MKVAVIADDPRRRAWIESVLRANSLEPADPWSGSPAVCVMSWHGNGDVAADRLQSRGGMLDEVPLVVVTRDKNPAEVRRLFRVGAAALVLEADLEAMLPAAVRAAAVGLTALPAGVRRWSENPAFSHRETQILRLMVVGKTNGEVGRELCLSESTVKSHLSSAFKKLGVASRREAARLLLDPAEGLSHVLWRGIPTERGERRILRDSLIGHE